MKANTNLFPAFRKSLGLSQVDAASTSRLSVASYANRERDPGEFRLKELKALYEDANDVSQDLLLNAVRSFFAE